MREMSKARKGYTDKLGRRWEWDDNNKKYVYQRKTKIASPLKSASFDEAAFARKQEARAKEKTEIVERIMGKDSDAARHARIEQKSKEITRIMIDRHTKKITHEQVTAAYDKYLKEFSRVADRKGARAGKANKVSEYLDAYKSLKAEYDRQQNIKTETVRAESQPVTVNVNKQTGIKAIKENIEWSKKQEAAIRDKLLMETDANKKAGLARQLKTYAKYTLAAKNQLRQFMSS